jgi:hypothetical protein
MKRSHLSTLIILLVSGLLLASPSLVHAQRSKAKRAATKAITSLSQAEALEDLEAFSERLREEAAYIELHRAAPFEAIESLKQRLPATVSIADFTRELQRIHSARRLHHRKRHRLQLSPATAQHFTQMNVLLSKP